MQKLWFFFRSLARARWRFILGKICRNISRDFFFLSYFGSLNSLAFGFRFWKRESSRVVSTVLCVWLYVLQMNNWTNSIWYYQYNVYRSMLLPHKRTHTHIRRGASVVEYTLTHIQSHAKHHPNTNEHTHLCSSHTPMTHMHTLSRRSLCIWYIVARTQRHKACAHSQHTSFNLTYMHTHTLRICLIPVLSCAYACLSTQSLCMCCALFPSHTHTHKRSVNVNF